MKTVKSVKDNVTFTLNEADLTGKKVGEDLLTPKRTVPCSDGLQWWIRWYPAGWREADKGHVSVYLWVNKPVIAKYTFAVDGSSISETLTHEFPDLPIGKGWPKFTSHEQLYPLFCNGKLIITCNVEFIDIQIPSIPVSLAVHQLSDRIPHDFELVVGSNILPVHKNFLSFISPVFSVMLLHDTRESRSGKDIITDFDFETVKTTIDFCYGRELKDLNAEKVVGMLRFADKYDIKGIITQMEKIPGNYLSVEAFAAIFQYAYDCSKDDLLQDCYTFFQKNQNRIKVTDDFSNLPVTYVINVLTNAFDLTATFDILRHAQKNEIDFLVPQLEQPLIESMTLDEFFPAVSYAWEYTREDLKKACVNFLKDNRNELMNHKSLCDITSEIIGDLIKLSLED